MEVTTDDTDGVISEGELISLMCAAYSDPTPVITWLKDNSPVDLEFAGNTRVSVTEELVDDNHVMSTLTIESALPSNEGEYKCRIDNHNIDDQPAVAAIEITVLRKSSDSLASSVAHYRLYRAWSWVEYKNGPLVQYPSFLYVPIVRMQLKMSVF